MAFKLSFRRRVLAFALLYVCLFWKLGNADDGDDDYPENQIGSGIGGAGVGNGSNTGVGGGTVGAGFVILGDPSQIVSKSLLCFSDIYKSCEEPYRLSEKGDLNVPREKIYKFCQGPCLSETRLVLSCLKKIYSRFTFSNKATIQDIRETIQDGCLGVHVAADRDLNVVKHMEKEADEKENRGLKGTKTCNVLMGLVLILMAPALLL
ncbi:uncharacterized protein LOC107637619 isoform X1 [Arachis ipaensis]|uniref:uncharacterized protein LOC107637619 isoform X1 n=1 Tax=Arachis ipaensis TaxID=130454 RepID=UPI000A2AFDBA|nr:uncharacterized protein LOC107637619 isoform X1 [Arachis ipaensis]XP_025644840.1 uncharacterized protein LOC112740288 isoform X1 [Arachis hypogaea]